MRYEQANVQPAQGSFSKGATSAVSVAASGIESLSARLENFSKSQFQIAGQVTQVEAARDATLDIANRKEKVNKIRNSDLPEKAQNEQIAKLLEGKTKEDFNIYGRAYNTAASASYANQVTVDAKAAADLAQAHANGDPVTFQKMYSEFEKQTVGEAPSKELAITAKRAFLQYGAETYKTIAVDKWKRQEKVDEKGFFDALDTTKEAIKKANISGDLVTVETNLAKMRAMGTNAIERGWITEDTFQAYVQKGYREVVIEGAKARFNDLNSKGQGHTMINELYKNEEYRKELTTEEFSKLETYVLSGINTKISLDETETRKIKLAQEKATIYTKKNILAAQSNGTLDQNYLDKEYTKGNLSFEEYEKYSGRVGKTLNEIRGNAKEYNIMKYGIELYDSDDIMSSLLNEDEKGKLLVDRKNYEEKVKDGWQSTTQGKEAVRRIKDNFPKASGLLGQFMSEEQAKELDQSYRQFYNEMLKLPMEEREQAAIPLAEAVIKTSQEQKETKKIAAVNEADKIGKERQKAKVEQLKKETEAYRSTMTEPQQKYYDGAVVMFRDSYGSVGDLNFKGQ